MKKVLTTLSLIIITSTAFAAGDSSNRFDNLVSNYNSLMQKQIKFCTDVATRYSSAGAINRVIKHFTEGREQTREEINVLQNNNILIKELQTSYDTCLNGGILVK